MSQQENNNLQDDTEPAQGIGVGGYMAAGAEATPSPKNSVDVHGRNMNLIFIAFSRRAVVVLA